MVAKMTLPDTPSVSVILPTYNRACLVGRAIRSVLAQTAQNLELIVVDDGSRDDTTRVVHGFNDIRIRYICHQANRGVSAARNTGICNSQGEYIAFLDSDDEWLPQKLERQLEVFAKSELPDLGIVVCGVESYQPDGTRQIVVPTMRGHIYEQVIAGKVTPLVTPIFCVPRSIVDAGILFDETLPTHTDWDFLAKICRRNTVDLVAEPLVRRYYLEDRLSRGEPWAEGLRIWINKYEQELRFRPKVFKAHKWTLIMRYYGLRHMGEVRAELRQMIRYNPWSLRWYTWFFASLAGRYAFGALNRLVLTVRRI